MEGTAASGPLALAGPLQGLRRVDEALLLEHAQAAAAFAFGLHQIWTLPVGIALHLAAAAATRSDPHVLDIVLVALKTQRRLDP